MSKKLKKRSNLAEKETILKKLWKNRIVIAPPFFLFILTIIIHLLGIIEDKTAGFLIALIALLFLLYLGVLSFLLNLKNKPYFPFVILFFLLWGSILIYHLYSRVYFGKKLTEGIISTKSSILNISLSKKEIEKGIFLTISGSFKPSKSDVTIAGDYNISILDRDNNEIEKIKGRFINDWPQKKSKDSFYDLFNVRFAIDIYKLNKLSQNSFQIKLNSLDTDILHDSLKVIVMVKNLPQIPIIPIGALFIFISLIIDYYLSEVRKRNLLSLLVASSFIFVYIFGLIGVPQTTLKPIIEGFIAGVVGGALLSAFLMIIFRPIFRKYDLTPLKNHS